MITHVAVLSDHDGQIHSLAKPFRHYHIIRKLAARDYPRPITGIQGFLNDKGKFLTREEAAKEAVECGQVNKLHWTKDKLFSEDLW